MHLTVTTQDGNVFPIDVADDMNLEDFFALCKHESDYLKRIFDSSANNSTSSSISATGRGVNSSTAPTLTIFFDGKSFDDLKQTLKGVGLKADDLLMVKVVRSGRNEAGQQNIPSNNPFAYLDFSSIKSSQFNGNRAEGSSTATNSTSAAASILSIKDAEIRNLYDTVSQDTAKLAELRHSEPELAYAVDNKDFDRFAAIIKWQLEHQKKALEDRAKILADPLSPEAQNLLLENINRQQIDEHMQIALEHTPESFASVHMLYIKCKINGHEVKAFVDCGAQTTIMSEPCAKKCGVTRLIDRRFMGLAKGVGTSKIVGRIHVVQMQIDKDYLSTSCTVIENQNVDLLLGLDMMKKHQCSVDLKRNVFVVGTTDTATPFLPESEIPPDFETPPKFDGKVGEKDIEKLVQMGFDRKLAIEALKNAFGDLGGAAAILLGTSASTSS